MKKAKSQLKEKDFIGLNRRLAFLNEIQQIEDQMICEKLDDKQKERLNELLTDIENF